MCGTEMRGAFAGVQMRDRWLAERGERVSEGRRISADRGHSYST